jgi:glucokinase
VYASGRGIAEAAGGRAAPLVFEAAAAGDAAAGAVVGEACDALGAMIGTIVNGLNPDVVVVTGGVAAAYAAREARVLRAAARHALALALARTRIAIVPGDKHATVRGPAALAFYEAEGHAP